MYRFQPLQKVSILLLSSFSIISYDFLGGEGILVFLKWLKVALLIFLAGFHCFRLFHMLFPNMLLWLSLPGLIQHLCSASIIRNIVSVCLASFSAVGSVSGGWLVWVCEALCSPGDLQGAQTCGSAPSVASALTAPVGHPGCSVHHSWCKSRCHSS